MAWHLDPVDELVVPAECAKHAEGDGNAPQTEPHSSEGGPLRLAKECRIGSGSSTGALRAFSSGKDAREHLVTRNLPSAIDGAPPDR
jgi:hypothetical protein